MFVAREPGPFGRLIGPFWTEDEALDWGSARGWQKFTVTKLVDPSEMSKNNHILEIGCEYEAGICKTHGYA